jgi:transposase
LDFVSNRRTYTKRLANTIIKSVLSSDIQSVAKQGVVTTEEIERMLSDASRELSSKPSGLKKLGIDEIALIKGQGNYCAVLIDLETSKLITILKGRTQAGNRASPEFMGFRGLRRNRRSKYRFVEGLQKSRKKTYAKCSSSSGQISCNGTSKQGVRYRKKARN